MKKLKKIIFKINNLTYNKIKFKHNKYKNKKVKIKTI